MNQALAKRDTTAIETAQMPMELTVQDVVAQVQKIQHVMEAVMKDGEHFGVIPGCGKKPSLLKPGAEKLCLTFRLDPQYESVGSVLEPMFIAHHIKCVLYHIPTGLRIASGLGSCNSRESKYRYREGQRVCPECGAEAIIKGKAEYGGGWLCFAKKGGCGAKWPDGAAEIESQQVGKIENENPWDQENTIFKMACKRALVAAVLNGTAASDIFTQDIEELVDNGVMHASEAPKAKPVGDDKSKFLLAERTATLDNLLHATDAEGAPYFTSAEYNVMRDNIAKANGVAAIDLLISHTEAALKKRRKLSAANESAGKALDVLNGESVPRVPFNVTVCPRVPFKDVAPGDPQCPKCGGDMKLVPAGKSKAGNKYTAFYGCKDRNCKGSVNAKAWADENQPSPIVAAVDDYDRDMEARDRSVDESEMPY